MIIPYLESVLPELGDATFDPATDIKETFELGGTQPAAAGFPHALTLTNGT